MRRAVMAVVILSTACAPRAAGPAATTSPAAAATAAACLADDLGPLTSGDRDPACVERQTCGPRCAAGDADACLEHAYALERRDDPASTRYYARSCQLGVAVGCTNYAAWMWLVGQPGSAPAPEAACARRLFERACAVDEAFGCGMIGRMRAAEASNAVDRAAARAHLERTCRRYGAMTCTMYAFHLEKGELGPHDPELVRDLLERACATGDDAACGHATAAEVFH